MKVVSVVSMKGGVGKTSVVSNLAVALKRSNAFSDVVCLDLDPQNALAWHFGFNNQRSRGICAQALSQVALSTAEIVLQKENGVRCYPFGLASEAERVDFESMLKADTEWLSKYLSTLKLDPLSIVLIDTPPGSSVYLQQVLSVSHLAIVAILADGASYATIPSMEAYFDETVALNPQLKSAYLLNQIDSRIALKSAIAAKLRQDLGTRFVPISLQLDEAIREALAFQKTVADYDAHSQATVEFDKLGQWVLKALQ